MSVVKIADLNLAGSSLLLDTETYLNELEGEELTANVRGGLTPFLAGVALSFAIGTKIWGK